MESSIFEGVLSHSRMRPIKHNFKYPIFMVLLDIDKLDNFFSKSFFWSLEKFNWASFRRKDYIQPSTISIRKAVIQEILNTHKEEFDGKIYLLTNIRYLGYCFNPVSFYFCYKEDKLNFIIAEVTNTPWNERHRYTLKCDKHSKIQKFNFPKEFHVSPFNPMDMEYKWKINISDSSIDINMANTQQDTLIFLSSMKLKRLQATRKNLVSVLVRYPATTIKTIALIYWQALKLKVKGALFFTHPNITKEL